MRYAILKDGKLDDKDGRTFSRKSDAQNSLNYRTEHAFPKIQPDPPSIYGPFPDWKSIYELRKRYEIVPVEITVGIIRPVVVESVKI
mgnify:CR=1 FL=1